MQIEFKSPCEPLTSHTIKRFINDFKLPIPVYFTKYIEYYVTLFDGVYQSVDKYNLLVETINKHGGNENLYQYAKNLREYAETFIKNNASYQDFMEKGKYEKFFQSYQWQFTNANIVRNQVYKEASDGKLFLSVDLNKADYQSLKYYSRHIVEEEDNESNIIIGTHNFDEFIGKFTDDDYFKKAKRFRTILFGHINPKLQNIIQKFIMEKIVSFCLEKELFTIDSIRDFNHDEVVFEIENEEETADKISAIKDFALKNDIDVSTDIFKLVRLNPYDFYVKEVTDGRILFKAIDVTFMPQCYKHYFGIKTLNEEDFLFISNTNMLSKYMERLFPETVN